jgi:hypothetical protein
MTTKWVPTRAQASAAWAALRKAGWEHRLTVMSGDRDGSTEYGMLWARGDERFWLNVNTWHRLNAMLVPAQEDGR